MAAAQYWLAACGIALTLLLLAGAALAGEPGEIGRTAAVAAVFLFLSLFAGMGLGDVKSAPAIGALLGWTRWQTVLWGTAVGFAVGAACAVALLLTGRGRREQVAYGPFMLVGALGVSVLVS
ncbi:MULTISPECIES: prepilin peptidase [Streptomyces]|uniref:prepilin peptidase n=1 Tax=Streptomyces TaxID=1883 RepID=UPI002E316988|nr:prepilin peptidase [Streptomyces canus]WSZ34887.1 prepilin peptidase [Streptomyces sp. NBC_00882]